MKVVKSEVFLKRLKSKRLQKVHKTRIDKIIKLLIELDVFHDLTVSSLAKIYRFEQLKHHLS